MSNLSLQVINFRSILKRQKEKSVSYEAAYNEQKQVSLELNKDLTKARNWSKRGLIGGPVIGFIVGFMIFR